jgi:hypothetical protein
VIPAILLRGVDPAAAAKPIGGRADALRLLPQLDPGDILSARIEAKLPDGSFKVLVAGQALKMTLPSYVAPGDTLELAFVTSEPRLTFALKEAAPQAPLPLLSAAGRLVAAAMPTPGAPALPAAAAAAAPLLAAVPADGAALSAALEHSFGQCGLFYESHQAEWLAGKRDLAQVLQEPQMRLTQGAAHAQTGAANTAAAAPDAPAAAARAQQMVHPDAVPLVQQQLAALDTGRVVLQLEVWPRQWMHWEIDEGKSDSARETDVPQSWSTQLRLDLPRLGAFAASLTLDGEGMRIRIAAADAGSAGLLREQRTPLQAALAAAGLPPASIAIAHHAPA